MMPSLIRRLRALTPRRDQLEANPLLRSLAPRLAHPKLWHWSRRSVATGMAIGLFIGLLIPVAQILFAAAAALALRANIAVAATGTLVTNPLTIPPIYYAAYHLGAWVTGSAAPATVSFADPASLWENLATIGMPLFAGLCIAAAVAAIASYVLVSQAWVWHVAQRRRGSGS